MIKSDEEIKNNSTDNINLLKPPIKSSHLRMLATLSERKKIHPLTDSNLSQK